MGVYLVARLLLVFVLMPGLLLQQTPTRIGKSCLCQIPYAASSLPKDSLADDTFYFGTSATIPCCKDVLLGYHDSQATIQWSFNGKAYSEGWTSSFKTTYCGNETITTNSGKFTDDGIYSCTIITSNGTSKTFAMNMNVEHNIAHRDKPSAMKSSSNVMAQLGDTAKFTCESYVGTNDTTKHSVYVVWSKYFPNNNIYGFADELPNVNVTEILGSDGSWGTMKGQLIISSVEAQHFGFYKCTVGNNYGTISFNMSLTEGIPETQVKLLQYKMTVVVIASLLVLVLLLLLGWCRWGTVIYLYCRNRKAYSEDHQYDVFLVHGESASRWVCSVLLPALEDSFGYTCFLPQRNMHGGEMIAESILEALEKCRRVVVVMTPCLLDSPWATWATYSGIHTALTSRARILALVHKKQSFKNDSLAQNPFLSVLKVVRKIKLPDELAVDLCDQSTIQHFDTPIQETNVQKTELKSMIPEIRIHNSSSNSLSKNQRLSNMISGSNTASREDLDCKKDKTTEVGGPVVFTVEDQGPQDPGSPNSVTPFILPSCRKPFRYSNGTAWHSVGWCLQMICIGNLEEQFWQTLRLHIGPPLPHQTQGH